jgi:hypothetical protein
MSSHRSSCEEYREIWSEVDKAAEEVAKWPDWKVDRVQAERIAEATCCKSERPNRGKR